MIIPCTNVNHDFGVKSERARCLARWIRIERIIRINTLVTNLTLRFDYILETKQLFINVFFIKTNQPTSSFHQNSTFILFVVSHAKSLNYVICNKENKQTRWQKLNFIETQKNIYFSFHRKMHYRNISKYYCIIYNLVQSARNLRVHL